MKTKLRQELMEKIRKEAERMRLELQQQLLSQQICAEPPVDALVNAAPKSTKGSCATPTTSGEDIIG